MSSDHDPTTGPSSDSPTDRSTHRPLVIGVHVYKEDGDIKDREKLFEAYTLHSGQPVEGSSQSGSPPTSRWSSKSLAEPSDCEDAKSWLHPQNPPEDAGPLIAQLTDCLRAPVMKFNSSQALTSCPETTYWGVVVGQDRNGRDDDLEALRNKGLPTEPSAIATIIAEATQQPPYYENFSYSRDDGGGTVHLSIHCYPATDEKLESIAKFLQRSLDGAASDESDASEASQD